MVEKFKNLLSHSIVYGLGSYAGRVVNFLLLPLYTFYLTPQDYGVLALVGTLGQILFVFLNLGQSTSIFRFYLRREHEEEKNTVISTALLQLVFVAIPVGGLLLLMSGSVAQMLLGGAQYRFFIWLGCLTVVFKVFLRVPFAIMRAQEQSKRYAVWTTIHTLLTSVLAIVFVVGWKQGVQGVLLSQLITELLLCLVLLGAVLRWLPLRFSGAESKALLSFGLPLIPAGIAGFALDLSDRYFLKHYTDLHQVGLYSLGYRFGEIIYMCAGAFQLAWPTFVFGNEKAANARSLYSYATTYYVGGMLFLCLAVSLFARELIYTMAAPAFHGAYVVVPLIALSGLFEGLTFVGSIGMNLQHKTIYRAVVVICAGLVNVVLNFLLIPTHGMMGAAVSTLVAFMFQSVLTFVIALHFYHIPYEYLRMTKATVIGLGIYALSLSIPAAPMLHAVGEKALLLLLYPLLLWVSGFFQPRELAYVKTFFLTMKNRMMLAGR